MSFQGGVIDLSSITINCATAIALSASGSVDIAPYAGLRFSFVHMDAMTARSGGSVIMNSDSTTKTWAEVLDRVNYSDKLGITGEAGSFGFGVGVSYTGSSNADNYAAMANVRWRF
ncbi:hypothetical protein [Sutterella sp.]|uniref:hypothetical protein n=1 Tax=Sutterella sp. TaxID=1981025 RepID=UPI0026E0407D|nr:hypothetical protein [Sutterella sp.]MDO5532931.1 hypothetical protein [Sutterella sp.]